MMRKWGSGKEVRKRERVRERKRERERERERGGVRGRGRDKEFPSHVPLLKQQDFLLLCKLKSVLSFILTNVFYLTFVISRQNIFSAH